MPSVYRDVLPPTRSPENPWQHRHPVLGDLRGGALVAYRGIPRKILGYTMGKYRPLESRRTGNGRNSKNSVYADIRRNHCQFISDQRMVLRPAIDRKEVFVVELYNRGGKFAGLVLLRAAQGFDPASGVRLGDYMRDKPVEILDYAGGSRVAPGKEKKRLAVEKIFPNSAIMEMWGRTQPAWRGGAVMKFRRQAFTIGAHEFSPLYTPEGAARVLFCANLATGELTAAIAEQNDEGPRLRETGTFVVGERAIAIGGSSFTKTAAVSFDEWFEEAAAPKPVENIWQLHNGRLGLSFAEPPLPEMAQKEQLSCRIWRGGIRIDWKDQIFRTAFAPDGTILDGLGRPVRYRGRTLNVLTFSADNLPRLNFWELLEGRIPPDLREAEFSTVSFLQDEIDKLLSGEEPQERCARIQLKENGKYVFYTKTGPVLFSCPFLNEEFKKDGEVLVALRKVKGGAALFVYDVQKRKHLATVDFDPKEKRFYYRKKGGGVRERSYIIKVDPHQPISILGKEIFPSGAILAKGCGFAYLDVLVDEKGKLVKVLQFKRPDRGARTPLKEVLDEEGNVIAYTLGVDSSRRLRPRISGWVRIDRWEKEEKGSLIFVWGNEKTIDRARVAALGIQEGEALWVKTEGKFITAVGVRREGKVVNIQRLKVVRNRDGEVICSGSKNVESKNMVEGRIFTGFTTRSREGHEAIVFGKQVIKIRPLTKGERFAPRQVSFVTDEKYQPKFFHPAPAFSGIMMDVAVAAAKIDREEVLGHLQRAAVMHAEGQSEGEIAKYLFGKEHPLLKEVFGRRVRGGKTWLEEQRKQAARLRRENDKIYADYKKARGALMDGDGYSGENISLRFAEIDAFMGGMREQSERNGSQSIAMLRIAERARLFWLMMTQSLAMNLFPYLIRDGQIQEKPEIIRALRFVDEKRWIPGKINTRDVLERIEEIISFLAASIPAPR